MSNSLRRSLLDEVYSEHPLTVVNQPKFEGLPSWLAELSTDDRADCILDIMSKLPTSEVWDIVGRLKPRLKMDFSLHLPSEICLRILGFLDPVSLIRTARASRHWQVLCFDRKLLEQLYIRDGFRVIRSEVMKFEFPSRQSRWWSPQTSFELNPSVERRTRGNIQQILPNPDGDDDN
ncbi:hypothetical protein BOTNAR_1163g00010 [Botryotinia narcissicola]|uniref:F-box domain-containing protein n=1 Tax=Botryotinia narcissicola TaxID=278944 RepID=A0A4Z1H4C7_9HELO|nr:hypothetical protein BOTNAR_1163g00010 [Botryotinia narcissicola]